MSEPNENEIFESIVEKNNLEEWAKNQGGNSLTISDLYEGIAILSSLQVELHEYLKKIIKAIFENNKAGHVVAELPQLTYKQVANLKQIFESSAIFLEE